MPNKWIFHLEGGGWCFNEETCAEKSNTTFGSSKLLPESYFFSGFLSDDCRVNPHFCGWSMIFLASCDGASFAGDE